MLKYLFGFLFISSAAYADNLPIKPDPVLTPGAVCQTDTHIICKVGYSSTQRHTSDELKQHVFDTYHIDRHSGKFEIDHLISLELGGCDQEANLWPQSYTTKPWNAHVKDRLENLLHKDVCTGKMSLEQAQHDIATDWIATYQKLIGSPTAK